MVSLFRSKQCATVVLSLFISIVSMTSALRKHIDKELVTLENSISSMTANADTSRERSDKDLETLESSLKAIQDSFGSFKTDNDDLFKLYLEAKEIENQLMKRRTKLPDILLTKVQRLQEVVAVLKLKIRDGIIVPINKKVLSIISELKAMENTRLPKKSQQHITALRRKLDRLQSKLSSMESVKGAVEVSDSLASIAVDVAYLKDTDKGPSFRDRFTNRVSLGVSRLTNLVRNVVGQFFR